MLRIWKTRLLPFLTAVIFGVMAITQPARAFAPVAVIAAPQIVSSGASMALTTLLGMVGFIGMYLEIEDATTGDQVRVPLTDKPGDQPPVPSAPSTGQMTGGTYKRFLDGVYYDSNADACTALGAKLASECTASVPCYQGSVWISYTGASYDGNVCTAARLVHDTTPPRSSPVEVSLPELVFQPTGCTSGYTLSGESCVLSSPRLATPDGKRDVGSSGGAYAPLPDIDYPSNPGGLVDDQELQPLFRNNGKVVIVPGRDSQGRPVQVEVERSEDGTHTRVRYYVQDNYNGQSVVNLSEAEIDTGTSQVTNVSGKTFPGSLSSPGTGSVPQISTGLPEPLTAPVPRIEGEQVAPQQPQEITVNTCGMPGQPKCQIDDSGFNVPPPNITVPDADLNAQKNGMESIVAPEVGWSWLPSFMPGAIVQCEPLQFRGAVNVGPSAGLDSTTTLDICPVFEIGRTILGYLFHIGAVIYIWRRFIGGGNEVA